jgi:hypothetical protein
MGGRFAIVRVPGHWVFAGIVDHIDEREVVLEKGVVIRRFGTTAGIGQLVPGPAAETVCDPVPSQIRISNGPGVFVIQAGDGWAAVIDAVR